MKQKAWILTIFLFKFAFSLRSLSEIDEDLLKVHQDCIHAQSGLVRRLKQTTTQIQACNEDLKAKNLAPKLLGHLESLAQQFSLFQTMDYFEPYHNIETCDDCNKKVMMMDFEVRKCQDVMAKLIYNVSQSQVTFTLANGQYAGEKIIFLA